MRGILIDKGARLYKPLRCPVWHLDLNLPGRKRQRSSLHTKNKDTALALARQLVQEALSSRWGVPLVTDTVFMEFFAKDKEFTKLHHAEGTRDLNWPVIERFAQFVTERRRLNRPLRLSDVGREDVEAFQVSEANRRFRNDANTQRGVRNRTVNIYVAGISAFFGRAVKRGVCRTNPAAGVLRLEEEESRHRALTHEEIQGLLVEASRPIPLPGPGRKGNGNVREPITPLLDLCQLILNTGLRLGEATHLEWGDVDFTSGILHVRLKVEYKRKDRKRLDLPMNAVMLEILSRRKLQFGSGRWVFPTRSGSTCSNRNLLRELHRVGREAALTSIDFYTLRHTFATNAARLMPPFILKELMGHSSVETTEKHYVHLKASPEWVPPEVRLLTTAGAN